MPRLEGIHHVTAITGDATSNVDFYTGVLGLRLVKKTVNYDAPEVYHLYFGDERGTPGSVLTFFEYPGARPGRPGAGMVHSLTWRVGSEAALGYWADRLETAGMPVELLTGSLASSDPEGLDFELVVVEVPDEPLVARAPGIPAEHALQGFHGVRAFARRPQDSERLLSALNFEPGAGGLTHHVGGELRHATYVYDHAPAEPGIPGAGTVHHVAWASRDEDHSAWRTVAQMAGARPTEIIDRTYFKSIYFREPSGVLFEIATLSPGFVVDEPWETLGESLVLPPQHEARREQLERTLTPVTNPRTAYGSTSPS
jgi:glyoxalase family protein